MSTDACGFCLNGQHESCVRPGQDKCCHDWIRIAPDQLRAFKFIAKDPTPVPGGFTYSGCAAVVVDISIDAAKESLKKYAAERGHDAKWIDYCRVEITEIEPGKTLLFVMQ